MKKDRHEAQDRQGARFDAHMAKLTAAATRLRNEADALDLAARRIADGVAEVNRSPVR